MPQTKITVQTHSKPRPTQWGDMHSFKANDGNWYSTGKNVPPPVGTYIDLTYTVDEKGYNKVKDITILTDKPTQTAAQTTASPVAGQMSKDDYWRNREARDLVTQDVIALQSCRNSAIALATLLLSNTEFGVPLPKKIPEREAFVVALVDKYTEDFRNKNKGQDKKNETTSSASDELPVSDSDSAWAA